MDYCSYLFSRVRKYFVLASSLLHLSKDSSLNTVFSLTREKQGQIISCNDNNREKVFELSNKTKITFYVIVLFVLLLWLNPFTFFITFFIHFCERIPLKCGQKVERIRDQRTNFGICYSLFTSSFYSYPLLWFFWPLFLRRMSKRVVHQRILCLYHTKYKWECSHKINSIKRVLYNNCLSHDDQYRNLQRNRK